MLVVALLFVSYYSSSCAIVFFHAYGFFSIYFYFFASYNFFSGLLLFTFHIVTHFHICCCLCVRAIVVFHACYFPLGTCSFIVVVQVYDHLLLLFFTLLFVYAHAIILLCVIFFFTFAITPFLHLMLFLQYMIP
jgi:hypothetical protein